MKKICYFSAIAFYLAVMNAYGACVTDVSGVINGASWTAAGSPYCVIDDVIVQDLTIEAGVRVQFMDDYTFDVIGILVAEGEQGSEILFRADTSNANGWQGILLDNLGPGSRIVYVKIEGSINSGMRIINSTPVIQHLSVANNEAEQGGGLYVELTTVTNELVLSDCLVSNNSSTQHGGGMYAIVATAPMTMERCKFNNNTANPDKVTAGYWGGGIYFDSADGDVHIMNSEISGNQTYASCSGYNCSSLAYGGGVYLSTGNVVFDDTIIDSNSVQALSTNQYGRGGGIYVATGSIALVNSIVSHNDLLGDPGLKNGGGIYIYRGTVELVNSDVVYNEQDGIYNDTGIVSAANSILYSNDINQVAGPGTNTINYSSVQGGWLDGTGNIDEDCLFAGPQDFHLSAGSLCVDAGDTAFPGLPDMDADGGPRVLNAGVDLGPYEFGGVPTTCPPGWNKWDVDCNDGVPDALTDGLLAVRYWLGLTGAALIDGAVGAGCRRCTASEIESYLSGW